MSEVPKKPRFLFIDPGTVLAIMVMGTLCSAFILEMLGHGEVPNGLIAMGGPILGFYFHGKYQERVNGARSGPPH